MANVYVWSAAAGAGTGADWANAYITLQAAMTAKAALDVFWVAHDHVQTQATAFTITSPGTDLNPCRVYCVNRAGTVPPVSADLRTTAQISTTLASNLSLAGTVSECYGVTFTAGSAANAASLNVVNAASRSWRFVNCLLKLGTSTAAARINFGTTGTLVVLENTQVEFASTSQGVVPIGRIIWRNTANAVLGTAPTILVRAGAAGSMVHMEGIDFNAMAGKALWDGTGGATHLATFKDCKLGAATAIVSGAIPTAGNSDIMAVRCDSGDTNYRFERYTYFGVQTADTTYVRSGGASDGTTPVSVKIVTGTQPKWETPFESLPITIWNETTGSPVTVTIQGLWLGGAVTNKNIWIDVEYLGTSGFPLGNKVTSTVADGLAAGVGIPAGSGTWSGGGTPTLFAMSCTVTPQEKGPITIYVRAALLSSTFYFDPKPALT